MKKTLYNIAEKMGIKKKRFVSGTMYEKIHPGSNYSPWNLDSDFQDLFIAIQPYSLVDRYRCYELWKLVEQASKLNEGALIEIGVWRGGTGTLIAKKAKMTNIDETVYLCDTFTGVVKADKKDSQYTGGEHSDTSLELVESLVFQEMKLNNVKLLKGIFPDETSSDIIENKFRFCHIDVDVYQSAYDIIQWIWDKLVIGGIIVYDDFGFKGCDGITKFVEEQAALDDRMVMHNLNGHAVVIKIK